MRFEDALRLAGLQPTDIVADGKRRRCKTDGKPHKKNGQYVLLPDGLTGFWRDFADTPKWSAWHDGTATQAAPVDPAILKARRDSERAERVQAVKDSRELWANCGTYRPHPYLTNKGLTSEGCHFLRLWTGKLFVDKDEDTKQWVSVEDTWLVVPLYWRDRLVNLQRISGAGMKRQMKKAPQTGCYLMLGRPRHAVTVICEGLATGLAIYQAIKHARVIVTFFADNLLPVVQELKPTGSVVIAADNDWKTKAKRGFNPGIEKAQNAASLIDCGVAWPDGIEGSDWSDALKEWGTPGIKRIERAILGKARYVMGAA